MLDGFLGPSVEGRHREFKFYFIAVETKDTLAENLYEENI
jgi:hypothetical protein